MARNPDTRLNVQFLDASGEKSSTTVHTADFTDPDYATEKAAFVTAIRALSDCTYKGETRSLTYIDTPDLVGTGQREDKYLVTYVDAVTNAVYTVTVPGRRNDIDPIPGTDFYDYENIEFLMTFALTFEAFVRSPQGNAVQFQSIRVVGRNV